MHDLAVAEDLDAVIARGAVDPRSDVDPVGLRHLAHRLAELRIVERLRRSARCCACDDDQ